ncbi:ornithine cyclodeaminase family protein [Agrobacterium cavarae]
MTTILDDQKLSGYSFMQTAIAAVEAFMLARADGKTVSPPRHHVPFDGHGDLVFTIGGITGDRPLAGFRVYDTFTGNEQTQIVAVWSADDASLKGIVLGERLGAIRTGAIGGVAIRHLSPPDAKIVGLIGSGLQARMQLAAAASVRPIRKAYIYSRDARHRAAFAEDMQAQLGLEVKPVACAKDAAVEADIVICATSSTRPVLDRSDLKPGAHINTLGPKTIDAHELGLDVAAAASITATDSTEQARSYASPFFLQSSSHEQRMVELSDIVAGRTTHRTSSDQTTLFCSVGLAGTEVAVAAAILDSLSGKDV